jgi:two-component system, NtrC family, response regulator AtoC
VKTVLFADDNEALRQLCRRVFEEEGYRVVLVEDGTAAMKAIEAEAPDVAILDVRMPRKDGLEVAELLHAIHPSMPVILYTAYDDICATDRRSRFAAACIDKSTDFTELTLAVGRLLSPGGQHDSFRFGLPPKTGWA